MDIVKGLEAWSRLLGQDSIIVDSQVLQTYQTATYTTSAQILAILKPSNRQQISPLVKIANEYSIPLYPISGGRNWGYGSRVPVKDGCIILDLGNLTEITDYNEELAYVTLEPGVTQGQLYQFLQERHSPLWMDATGAGLGSSLIGNVMERGFGHTPYGDRFSQVCGLEVVLPTGECIHTGFGRFPNAQAASVYRWGVGAYLDGLFTQSNLGIVTQMTFWLMPAPECFGAFSFSIDKDEELPALLDALRPLRLDDTLRSAIHVGNHYKVLSSVRLYPWAEMEGKTPLSLAVIEQLSKSWDYKAWNGFGGLYGSREQVAAARRLLKKALAGKVARLTFLDDRKLQWGERLAPLYQKITGIRLPEMLKIMRPVYDLMKGIPSSRFLESTYWRKKTPIPEEMEPNRDGCGLIWCAPVVPLDGKHAAVINRMATETILSHGFEPMLSLTLLTGRCLGCIISISYDRAVEGEDERAMACYKELSAKLTGEGYYPYRLGIQSMDLLAKAEDSYQHLMDQLKQTLDPKGILAPGRYQP